MPAIEHAFNEPLPGRLYVDTDIFVNFLVGSQPHHSRCLYFLDRLQQASQTTLYVSWLELTHVITRPGFRDGLTEDLQRRYRIGRWSQPEIRRPLEP